jgi:thiol:disulfide interchange protein
VDRRAATASWAKKKGKTATNIGIFLAIGACFAPMAALTAFLITYGEYVRHKLPARVLWREALGSAGLAFAVFLLGPPFLWFALSLGARR